VTPTSQRSSRRSACTHPPSIQRSPPHLTTPRFRQLCRTILARSPSHNIDALHCTAAASKHTSKSPLLTPTLRFQLNHPSSSNRAHFTHIVRFTIVILFDLYSGSRRHYRYHTHARQQKITRSFSSPPTNASKHRPGLALLILSSFAHSWLSPLLSYFCLYTSCCAGWLLLLFF
jgi:hypothetical protein